MPNGLIALLDKVNSLRARVEPPKLCSDCFTDQGLRVEARKVGRYSPRSCPHCGSRTGAKLNRAAVYDLAINFFQRGSFFRTEYGGASQLRLFQRKRNEAVAFPVWLQSDTQLIEHQLGMEVDYYGPPLWRLGEVEPLKALEDSKTQSAAAQDAVNRFPKRNLDEGETFYRLRKDVANGKEHMASQYDAPPKGCGVGRLNDVNFPILYGSQDLEICIHECRVTKADTCHVATLEVGRSLVLLDLCAETTSDGPTPFQSVSIAIKFLFAAESHSYGIARAIARAACAAGFDGIAYPSYFSSFRGDRIPNIGLFGRPMAGGAVKLLCVNRLLLDTAQYGFTLGPCLTAT